jgi:hypothetical protein
MEASRIQEHRVIAGTPTPTPENRMSCSRCGARVQLPGLEQHNKFCAPIVERHEYFIDKYGVSCRKNCMTDEIEFACTHRVHTVILENKILRDAWENRTVWHRANEALRCVSFKGKSELHESIKVQAIMQWARQNRRR